MPDGPIDYDAMWERIKDRIQERQPGITKETWMEQAKERHRQMEQQGGSEAPAGPPVSSATRDGARAGQRGAAGQTRAPSGIFKAGGPFYQGEYALRPGMTANVTIITNQKNAILRVPNTALRFDPTPYVKPEPGAANQQGQPSQQGQGNRSNATTQRTGLMVGGSPFGPPPQNRGGGGRQMDRGMVSRRDDKVWTLDEKRKPKSVSVRVGLTDGQFTEVIAEGVSEGMDILVGVDDTKKGTAGASPFQQGGQGGRR
jgi:hypothetical protein